MVFLFPPFFPPDFWTNVHHTKLRVTCISNFILVGMAIGNARHLDKYVARRRVYLIEGMEQAVNRSSLAKQQRQHARCEAMHTKLTDAWDEYWRLAETLRVTGIHCSFFPLPTFLIFHLTSLFLKKCFYIQPLPELFKKRLKLVWWALYAKNRGTELKQRRRRWNLLSLHRPNGVEMIAMMMEPDHRVLLKQ